MDVLLQVGPEGVDVAIENGDLVVDEGLGSAVLLSLFVDRRAEFDDEIPASESDPRGWPLEPQGDRWGSRLWLFERAKATADSAALARAATLQGLSWLVEDEIAERVEAEVEIQAGGRLAIAVELERGRARRWPQLWAGVAAGKAPQALGTASLRILTR